MMMTVARMKVMVMTMMTTNAMMMVYISRALLKAGVHTVAGLHVRSLGRRRQRLPGAGAQMGGIGGEAARRKWAEGLGATVCELQIGFKPKLVSSRKFGCLVAWWVGWLSC